MTVPPTPIAAAVKVGSMPGAYALYTVSAAQGFTRLRPSEVDLFCRDLRVGGLARMASGRSVEA
jgi:hypothetical protein